MAERLAIDTPIGPLGIIEEGGAITHIYFAHEAPDGLDTWPRTTQQETLSAAQNQLSAYFAGERQQFDLPLAPSGTDFQQKVWRALQDIPYGETRCYGDIASAAGNPKAARAVGMANHNNPIPIVIPCHRVIGKNGKLVGFGGGLDTKEALLALEKR